MMFTLVIKRAITSSHTRFRLCAIFVRTRTTIAFGVVTKLSDEGVQVRVTDNDGAVDPIDMSP